MALPQIVTTDHPGRKGFVRGMARLGIDVSRETTDRLQIFVETLTRWQKTINLVGRATLDDVWARHILDSAQLLPLIPDKAETLVDLGSGAGFPGLVMAALAPHLAVTLIEADARKAAFLGEASRRMGLEKSPAIRIGRIESVAPVKSDVVTARALAQGLCLAQKTHAVGVVACRAFEAGLAFAEGLAGDSGFAVTSGLPTISPRIQLRHRAR